MVPEKSWVSWVTKPIFSRNWSRSISLLKILLYKISPCKGWYKPTSNFTNVVFPEPEGPTKAMVSPLVVSKLILFSAFRLAVLCLKLTLSKVSVFTFSNNTGFSGLGSIGVLRIPLKLPSDTSASRHDCITLPNSCNGLNRKNE